MKCKIIHHKDLGFCVSMCPPLSFCATDSENETGIRLNQIVDGKTNKPKAIAVAIIPRDPVKTTVTFNYCPFCGTDLQTWERKPEEGVQG